MKKTKQIQLVLITAAFAACHQSQPEWRAGGHTYIRGDSTAPYSRMDHPHSGVPFAYYHFRPYGLFFPIGGYHRQGYYSNALSEEVNIGSSAAKSSIVRGGFGQSAFSVES
jgi:hypothetical protein